jgi:adenylylsulfate kinase
MPAGEIVWMTGRPASGKSTLARRLASELRARQIACCLLDGDEVRHALVPAPGYDEAGRDAFYASLAGLAALLAGQGLVVVVAATAHRRAFRERARAAFPRFCEVYVDVPAAECAARDPKGLYRAGAAGLPGTASTPYEPPLAPEVVATGGEDDVALARLLARHATSPPARPLQGPGSS